MDRHQYSSTFEKERDNLNAMQYSSRNRPRERLEMGNVDPYARAQYNMGADLNASRPVSVSSYRSDVCDVKSTHDRLTDSRAAGGKLGDSRYNAFSQNSSSQNPYSRRAVNLPGDSRDSPAVNSGMDKRYSTAAGYENTGVNFDRDHRMGDSSYTSRQTPSASYYGREQYPPPNVVHYRPGERHPPPADVAPDRVATASKKYSSPTEEDLRRTVYDKKYQMEGQAAVEKRQPQTLGDSQFRLSQREKEDLERAYGQRLDSARGRYNVGDMDRIESSNRTLRAADNTRLSSDAVAPSQRRNVVKSTDPPNARNKFTKAENGKESSIDRSRGYSDLSAKPPKSAIKLKDDYHGDSQRERAPVSSGRVQNTTTVPDRKQYAQLNERQLAVDNRRLQSGESGSSLGTAEDSRPASKRESSSSLLKMKEDLLRDQMRLDRQLRANAMASEERTLRSDHGMRYDKGRSPDLYGRSSYATDERVVWISLCNDKLHKTVH